MIVRALQATLAFAVLMASPVLAGDSDLKEEKIKRAMKAAPSMISDNALILDLDGSVLRQGSNGWTCYPGVPLIADSTDPMCNDPIWQAWIKADSEGKSYTTEKIGFSYMLAGDGLVNNDDPGATDQNQGTWIKEGPHIMLLLPKSALGDVPTTPAEPGPYVMWGESPMFHLMVPVADRPEGALIIHQH